MAIPAAMSSTQAARPVYEIIFNANMKNTNHAVVLIAVSAGILIGFFRGKVDYILKKLQVFFFYDPAFLQDFF